MRVAIVAMALAAAGCTHGTAAPAGTCDAAKVQDVIGRALTDVQEDAMRRSGARTVRTYATGSAVTMDYRPDRLNLETGPDGAIVKATCG